MANINLNGFPMRVRANLDNSYSTTTGVNVTPMQLFTNQAITDTATHDSAAQDVSGFLNKSMFINNTLNQSVTVSVIVLDPNGSNPYVVASNKIVTAGTTYLITASDIAVLSAPFTLIKIRLQCTVAPASGNINAWILGA